ncbi:YbhB/YbcL family Raf kinase inhibitor-like protein [Natronomonas sp. EA1]|uniref:YbhB/YbcL family Raf kinase inhibitor-like protein n=1 Tax=Natronomonas sp. EA1 TaxID=3421655 RepID=UPI003EBB7CE3
MGTHTDTTDLVTGFTVRVPAFEDEGTIPPEYTCDGVDVSPALEISGVPPRAQSLAVLVDDPVAPTPKPFVHWAVWNVPPETRRVDRGIAPVPRVASLANAPQGTNGFGKTGYGGPCPPTADDPHRYRFRVFALDTVLDLDAGATGEQLNAAMKGHILTEATYEGRYARQEHHATA